MSFQPVVVGTGLVGWRFLQATFDAQRKAFDQDGARTGSLEYFASRIGSVTTAAQLVDDRRLLGVALTAFGLQDDLNNRYFVQRVLEDGTIRDDALANRLADDRYVQFSSAFGFGDFSTPRTQLSHFPEEIAERFSALAFEQAVGNRDQNMRLALNLQRALPELTDTSGTVDTWWFRLMGNPPLRQVFETALSLPKSVGKLDIDQQLQIFKSRADARFGTSDLSALVDSEMLETVTETFLLQSQLQEVQSTMSGSGALLMLENASAFQKSLGAWP